MRRTTPLQVVKEDTEPDEIFHCIGCSVLLCLLKSDRGKNSVSKAQESEK